MLRSLHIYSLSVKVITAFTLATAALLGVLWLTLGMTFDKLLSDNIEPYFTNHLISLQSQVGVPPNINVAKRIAAENPVIIEINAPGYRWSSNANFVNDNQLDIKLQQVINNKLVAEAGFYRGNFILRTYENGYIISFIMTEKLSVVSSKILWLALAAIVAIIVVLFIAITYLFRPVRTIERSVKRIGNGEVSHRVSINRDDELGSLSDSVNKMADNIEHMLEAKRHLLLAISHELRTPITRAKLALSMLDDDITKDSVTEDIDEMESLIKELLESERLRSNHTPLERAIVNINDIIYQVQGRFFHRKPLVVELDETLPEIDVDPTRIGLAIKNIIKNAFTASTSPDAEVVVRSALKGEFIEVSISDSGSGIDAKDIPHLTEPFYRPDSSRQRKTGGVGLGLYLIKAIVDAHGGELLIDSELGKGTTMTIVLPLTPPEESD